MLSSTSIFPPGMSLLWIINTISTIDLLRYFMGHRYAPANIWLGGPLSWHRIPTCPCPSISVTAPLYL